MLGRLLLQGMNFHHHAGFSWVIFFLVLGIYDENSVDNRGLQNCILGKFGRDLHTDVWAVDEQPLH